MSKRFQIPLRAAFLGLLTGLTVMTSGCFLVVAGAAAGAGAGAVAYVDGKLTVNLGNPYEAVVNASDRAIAQLQFLKVGESRDALKAILEARTSDDKKVAITVTRVSDTLTKVEIRVGTFGDKTISRAIYDRIKGNL
ncbi:MAG TPA: DUF3568 family protein [Opitutaceae bacterium]|nr:DUF3568 family protein [Opitutaceae bacterium]